MYMRQTMPQEKPDLEREAFIMIASKYLLKKFTSPTPHLITQLMDGWKRVGRELIRSKHLLFVCVNFKVYITEYF
jgi:hypothetical protein